MSQTYDITNNIGKVRLMIGDKNVTDATTILLNDEEITYFLSEQDDDLYLAASDCCRAIVADRARLNVAVTYGTYSTRQEAAKWFMELAKRYEERAVSGGQPAFGVAEQVQTKFSVTEILANKALKEDA